MFAFSSPILRISCSQALYSRCHRHMHPQWYSSLRRNSPSSALPDTKVLDEVNQIAFVPFDPSLKRTEATVQLPKEEKPIKITKGATTVLLDMAQPSKEVRAKVEEKVLALASSGYRSIAVAKSAVEGVTLFLTNYGRWSLGIVGNSFLL